MPENESNHNQFLLSELSNGHEKAFDFIFRQYYKALCAQANLYIHDLDKAQSLVQECFIKLWENRSKASHIKNMSSYLSFMVRNQCIDYLRSVKSPTELCENTSRKGTNSLEEQVFLHDFEEKLVAALATLPERSREAFEYSRFENLPYKEIAKKMGISVKAVEALMGRSLKILRHELKDYLPILIALYNIGAL